MSVTPETEHGIGPHPASVLDEIATRPLPDRVLMALFGVISLLATGAMQTSVRRGDWSLIALDAVVATVASVATLWLWQLVELRFHCSPATRRWLDVLGFGTAGVVGSAVSAIVVGDSPAPSAPWWTRLIAALIVTVPALLLIAWLLARMARARITVAELESRRDLELRNQHRLTVGRERIAVQIREVVEQVARPAVRDSLAVVAGLRRDPAAADAAALRAAAERIRAHSEMEIRPLSHELGDLDSPLPGVGLDGGKDSGPAPGQPRVLTGWGAWFSSAVRLASRVAPFQPIPVVVTMSFLLAPSVGWLVYPASFLPALIVCMLVIGGVAGIGRLARRWIARTSGSVRVITVTAVYLLAGWLAHLAIARIFGEVFYATDWVLVLADVMLVPVIGWVWALVAASGYQADVATRQLEAAVAMVRWQSARLDQILVDIRRRAAELTHGDVQGRFIAAAMALMSAAGAAGADPVDRDLIEEDLRMAEDCLQDASVDIEGLAGGSRGTSITISDLLRSVVAAWRGIVDVRLELPDPVAVGIDRLPGLGEIIGAVVREAIGNAARHGAAEHVLVSIGWSDHPVIVAEDDGIGPGGTVKPGMGLKAVVRAGGTWRLARSERTRGALLTVDLPVPAEVESVPRAA